jgi:PAS domain S-box-containing protein
VTLSLKTKVTLFITAVMIAASAVSTTLFIAAQRESIEREVLARGIALSEALARSVDDGLASENLNLIKSVSDIVHTDDVLFTQVFSVVWLGVASVPVDRLNVPPAPDAMEYFKKNQQPTAHYFIKTGPWIDIYHPVFLDTHDVRIKDILIGFVRLRISTEPVSQAIRNTVLNNILAAVLLTVLAVIVLNALIGRYLVRPILALQRAVARHQQGEFPESVQVSSSDEIGRLTSEFNAMSLALREREERLAEEKERLAVTLRSIGDAVIVTDVTGVITMINKVAEHQTGWTLHEAAGRQLAEVFNIISEKTGERCENPMEKVLKTGTICGLANHTVLIRRDGTRIVIEDSAAPIRDRIGEVIGIVLVFRDVTEKQRIEEELTKVEKLQSVGVLAGGLAHDFNNLLTSMVGNISMAKRYIDNRSKAYVRLNEAEAASRRATDLTYQLLTFAKGGAPVKRAASIVDILREAASFTLSGTTTIAAEASIDDNIWAVEVDAGQISQVFSNLIINAVQAMPNGGTLRYAVCNAVLEDQEVPSLKAGAYVKISLHDTGTGIPTEHLPRIFDPYFTTKQKGSGLGLASVYSIIKKHDGHILVESSPEAGTTFHIYLPASHCEPVPPAADTEVIARGNGSVLVMDDEEIVREVSGEMLRSLGYTVELAKNGAEAIALYHAALEAKRPFDVVIMDLTIPGGMGGKEAVQQLRTLDPKVKAIVSSGYSNDPVMADYPAHGFKGVIVKPYDIASFSKTLGEVMKG